MSLILMLVGPVLGFAKSRFGLPIIIGAIALLAIGAMQVRYWWVTSSLENQVVEEQQKNVELERKVANREIEIAGLKGSIVDLESAVRLQNDAARALGRSCRAKDAEATNRGLRELDKPIPAPPAVTKEANSWLNVVR